MTIQFLRIGAVAQRVGLSKSSITRLVEAGRFPKPVTLTRATVAWVEGEVERWMRERIAERDCLSQSHDDSQEASGCERAV